MADGITLYEHELSGNCYRVRLFLALLGQPFRSARVDLFTGEGQRPDYLALNPLGQVPTLVDDGEALRDSHAILFYLARRYGGPQWLPDDPLPQARVLAWLAFSASELTNGPAALRIAVRFQRPVNIEWSTRLTRRAFGVMESTLAGQAWLMPGDRPTIADVACFPYTALAHEGDFSLAPYPAIGAWCDRVRALPGFVAMQGL